MTTTTKRHDVEWFDDGDWRYYSVECFTCGWSVQAISNRAHAVDLAAAHREDPESDQ